MPLGFYSKACLTGRITKDPRSPGLPDGSREARGRRSGSREASGSQTEGGIRSNRVEASDSQAVLAC